MALSIPSANDQFTENRSLLEKVYRFDTSKINPADVNVIADLSEGGALSVDELRPLYQEAIRSRMDEISLAQSLRVGRR